MIESTHSQEEIDSRLNILIRKEEELMYKRKSINSELKALRKDIKALKHFDFKQLKAF